MDSFVVFNILLFVLFSFLFLPFSFSEVETASEMTKTMLEWVFYLLKLMNIASVNWPEQFILSLNQKKYITKFREHCSLPFRKRSFLGPEFTKFHLAAGLRPDPLGELTALPKTPSQQYQRRGGRWEWKRGGKERNHRKQREMRDQGKPGKGRDTWNNGVCVPYCLSALLATI